jgi:hypothetical protein
MGPPSQLTPCDRPLLCTAVLRPRLTCDPIRDSHTAVIPGSARTRHRFGDKGGRGGDLLAARRDGCQAEGWAARRDCVPCAPPLGLAGEDPRREDHHYIAPCDEPTAKIDDRGDTSRRQESELLTPNQVFGSRQTAAPSSDREFPDLHQLVHQRLRTTMDILGREPKDHVRPRTNSRYWRGAAYDYGSEGFIVPYPSEASCPRSRGRDRIGHRTQRR